MIFCLQNKTCIFIYLRIYDRIYPRITYLKWFFEFVKQLWSSISFPSQFLVSITWETVTLLSQLVEFCGQVSVSIHDWTVSFKNIQPRTLNGIEKPQNPKDFFCNSNHRFSQISSWLIHDTTGAFTNVPGFLNTYTDKTHLTRLSLWIRYW